MSVSRDVIASVHNVPEKYVNCRHCLQRKGMKKVVVPFWCMAWNNWTKPNDFCSFYEPKANIGYAKANFNRSESGRSTKDDGLTGE